MLGTLLTYKEIIDIKDTFYALDKNLSGSISYDELRQAFSELQIESSSKELELLLRDIFFRIDVNNDEQISYSEFLTACLDPATHLTRENIVNAFKYFDADNQNCLTSSGLQKVFLRSGRLVSHQEIENIFNEIQMQVDEVITLNKFIELFEVKNNKGSQSVSPHTSTAPHSLRNSFKDEVEI